jgi:hypothetical protein
MADESHSVEQDEIEQLLRQAAESGGAPMSDAAVSQDDIE